MEETLEKVLTEQEDGGNGATEYKESEYIPDYFDGSETLRNLYADVRRGKIKYRFLAHKTGYSKGTLSGVFNGTYSGKIEEIIRRLEKAAEEYYDRGDLVKTRNFTDLRALCRLSWENLDINAAYGPAGCGKTEALKSYWQENIDTCIYLPIWESDTAKEVVNKIAYELGIQFGRESLSERITRITKQLRLKPRLILVDEADQAKVKILNLLRQIWDEGDCGMVIAGNLKLKYIMTRSEDMLQNLSYLYRRISTVLKLQNTTLSDARLLTEKYPAVTLTENGLKELVRTVKENGEIDRLCKIFDAAIEQAEYNRVEVVNDEVVFHAASTMLWS